MDSRLLSESVIQFCPKMSSDDVGLNHSTVTEIGKSPRRVLFSVGSARANCIESPVTAAHSAYQVQDFDIWLWDVNVVRGDFFYCCSIESHASIVILVAEKLVKRLLDLVMTKA